jgi:hypothetical protein
MILLPCLSDPALAIGKLVSPEVTTCGSAARAMSPGFVGRSTSTRAEQSVIAARPATRPHTLPGMSGWSRGVCTCLPSNSHGFAGVARRP